MTTNDLKAGYHRTCGDRLAAPDVLHARAEFSHVVGEGQEVVDLALEGMLCWEGIDPARWRTPS